MKRLILAVAILVSAVVVGAELELVELAINAQSFAEEDPAVDETPAVAKDIGGWVESALKDPTTILVGWKDKTGVKKEEASLVFKDAAKSIPGIVVKTAADPLPESVSESEAVEALKSAINLTSQQLESVNIGIIRGIPGAAVNSVVELLTKYDEVSFVERDSVVTLFD